MKTIIILYVQFFFTICIMILYPIRKLAELFNGKGYE